MPVETSPFGSEHNAKVTKNIDLLWCNLYIQGQIRHDDIFERRLIHFMSGNDALIHLFNHITLLTEQFRNNYCQICGSRCVRALFRGTAIAMRVAACCFAIITINSQSFGQGADDLGSVRMSAAELLSLAEDARARGDFDRAETIYRAVANDGNLEIRCEARFRLGMMLANDRKRPSSAAIEFRHILDEQPRAARVRVELARMQALLGNMSAAERELRTAEASGLPREAEQLVRFYAQALKAQRPFGGSLEVALAPDSNINRATRASTLNTVIGDFVLDDDARARSGIGLSVRGQAFARAAIGNKVDLLVRPSGSALLYRRSDFNDVSAGLQVGPQIASGTDNFTLSAGPTWRWYGTTRYSSTIGGSVIWQHPASKRGLLRIEGGYSHVDNRRNPLQTARDLTASVSYDRAFTARSGGGFQVFGFREAARDPGYSLVDGGATLYAFQELGRATLVGTIGYSRLEADERLFLFPRRRVENRYSASLATTFRQLHVGRFAPLTRIRWERNQSSIGIYDYNRVSTEIGLTSAF
jgi:hypothetical protein